MLSASFKKTLKDTLKNEYEIECHRISLIPPLPEGRGIQGFIYSDNYE